MTTREGSRSLPAFQSVTTVNEPCEGMFVCPRANCITYARVIAERIKIKLLQNVTTPEHIRSVTDRDRHPFERDTRIYLLCATIPCHIPQPDQARVTIDKLNI